MDCKTWAHCTQTGRIVYRRKLHELGFKDAARILESVVHIQRWKYDEKGITELFVFLIALGFLPVDVPIREVTRPAPLWYTAVSQFLSSLATTIGVPVTLVVAADAAREQLAAGVLGAQYTVAGNMGLYWKIAQDFVRDRGGGYASEVR